LGLECPHDISPPRLRLPGALRSAGITPFHHYYGSTDFLPTFSTSLLIRLVSRYFLPGRASRISHVHRYSFDTCHALRPRRCHQQLPIHVADDVAFPARYSVSHLSCVVNGAQSLQPCGLRPISFLSTLSHQRFHWQPKTRFRVCWVGTSRVAFPATRLSAPRGARLVEPDRLGRLSARYY